MGRGSAVAAEFEERLDELWRCAFRAAFRVLRSVEAAEDVAEETLIRAYGRWPSVADHAAPWVTRVAVNLAISTWRHEHRRPAVEASAAGLASSGGGGASGVGSAVRAAGSRQLVAGLDGRVGGADRLDVGDRTVARVDLLAALARLSARQRQVLGLRYLGDLPDGAIAEALGCSAGAVKRHAARGLARLRTDLGVAVEVEQGDRTEPVTREELTDGC